MTKIKRSHLGYEVLQCEAGCEKARSLPKLSNGGCWWRFTTIAVAAVGLLWMNSKAMEEDIIEGRHNENTLKLDRDVKSENYKAIITELNILTQVMKTLPQKVSHSSALKLRILDEECSDFCEHDSKFIIPGRSEWNTNKGHVHTVWNQNCKLKDDCYKTNVPAYLLIGTLATHAVKELAQDSSQGVYETHQGLGGLPIWREDFIMFQPQKYGTDVDKVVEITKKLIISQQNEEKFYHDISTMMNATSYDWELDKIDYLCGVGPKDGHNLMIHNTYEHKDHHHYEKDHHHYEAEERKVAVLRAGTLNARTINKYPKKAEVHNALIEFNSAYKIFTETLQKNGDCAKVMKDKNWDRDREKKMFCHVMEYLTKGLV